MACVHILVVHVEASPCTGRINIYAHRLVYCIVDVKQLRERLYTAWCDINSTNAYKRIDVTSEQSQMTSYIELLFAVVLLTAQLFVMCALFGL